MDNVIYAASPLAVFLSVGATVLFILGLGVFGMLSAVLGRNQKRISRLAMGALGGVLILAGRLSAFNTLRSAAGSTQSVVISLQHKRIAQDNCNDGQTCTRYVLETVSSTKAYDFNVPREAYDRAVEGACYQFTYYPPQGMFADNNASYQQIDSIARIEATDPARCK